MSTKALQHHPIRSYVLRQGRLTRAQRRALVQLWPVWGTELTDTQPISPRRLFGNNAPTTLEIGFGNGENLLYSATTHPERNYLGVEIHSPGVGHLLLGIEQHQLHNIRVVRDDAARLLAALAQTSLAEVLLFFPDPWPKKRHHKRRLLQTTFVHQLARVLQCGGHFRAATDCAEYAQQMMVELIASPAFDNAVASGGYSVRPQSRIQTRFERRAHRLKHTVIDLHFIRNQHA